MPGIRHRQCHIVVRLRGCHVLQRNRVAAGRLCDPERGRPVHGVGIVLSSGQRDRLVIVPVVRRERGRAARRHAQMRIPAETRDRGGHCVHRLRQELHLKWGRPSFRNRDRRAGHHERQRWQCEVRGHGRVLRSRHHRGRGALVRHDPGHALRPLAEDVSRVRRGQDVVGHRIIGVHDRRAARCRGPMPGIRHRQRDVVVHFRGGNTLRRDRVTAGRLVDAERGRPVCGIPVVLGRR